MKTHARPAHRTRTATPTTMPTIIAVLSVPLEPFSASSPSFEESVAPPLPPPVDVDGPEGSDGVEGALDEGAEGALEPVSDDVMNALMYASMPIFHLVSTFTIVGSRAHNS